MTAEAIATTRAGTIINHVSPQTNETANIGEDRSLKSQIYCSIEFVYRSSYNAEEYFALG